MREIGFKKMNWMPKQSAWNEHIQKLAKRRTMMRAFERQNNALINAFANTFDYQIHANVDNVARTAADRIIAEGKKKAEELQNKLTSSTTSPKSTIGNALDISA
jgi:predicted secreted protein